MHKSMIRPTQSFSRDRRRRLRQGGGSVRLSVRAVESGRRRSVATRKPSQPVRTVDPVTVPGRLGPAEREDSWRRLGEETFDLVVIGGGVVGAGTALDAATRGLKVALVEARDLASGTSSRSSKLFHGGLR